ncbi:TPA: erythromycin biosynthesis sensory transduction protein eryC1 [Candidatus Latescibacteria bacterium]|nr:erythromycin biosynthesis sensory transduction protein eryC1 [Candidatus Latescibacterota bacterium]
MATAAPTLPFIDLVAQYESIKPEIDDAIQSVINRAAFAGGAFVTEFEKSFAAYQGVAHGVGVSSGTSALHVLLEALDIGRGDEVITVTNTFIATAEAIVQTGATPVLLDVDDMTLSLNPGLLENAITPNTKAIVPVHLYGLIADMDPILEIAQKHGLYVLEDAAQAHGAEHRGKRAGQFGLAATFSFYPGKILGAFGDAGGIVTADEDLANRLRSLADHGRTDHYQHARSGFNYRMDGIQAAVLDVKLKHLEEWIEIRRRKARLYSSLLSDMVASTPVEADGFRHVHTYYVIRTPIRKAITDRLSAEGIQTIVHYPTPLHLQPAFADFGHKAGEFPIAEKTSEQILSLPLYPELADGDIERICDLINGLA